MPKYVAGHSGRLETSKDDANYGKPRKGEHIMLGGSHFNEGEEIPERIISKLDPKTLAADLARGIIRELKDAPAKPHEKAPEKQPEKQPEKK